MSPYRPTVGVRAVRLPIALRGLLAAALLLLPLSAQGSAFQLDGVQAGEALGSAVAILEDLDGDGWRDFAVGSKLHADPMFGPVGRVSLHSGATLALLWATVGTEVLSEFGSAIDRVEDLDGDGFPDLVVGAPGSMGGDGRVHVLSGRTGFELWFRDGMGGERLGFSVAGLDDQDGDSVPDVVAGGPFHSSGLLNQGIARVLQGTSGFQITQFRGSLVGEVLGFAVRDAGQLAGDSRHEILVGGPFHSPGQSPALGRVVVIEGGTRNFHLDLQGVNAGQQFGSAVEAVSDLTGDGVRDLIIGAPSDDGVFLDTGIVYLIDGAQGQIMTSWSGQQSGELLGSTIARLGARNSDTLDEFVLGAPGYDDGGGPAQGRVVVINGSTLTEITELFGPAPGSCFGDAISRGARLDPDSRDDFLVGAPGLFIPPTATGAGRVVAYHSPFWSTQGSTAPANVLSLRINGGVALGAPTTVVCTGAPTGANGYLGYALAPASTLLNVGSLGQGEVLIDLNPLTLFLEPTLYDTNGEFALLRPIPPLPELSGRGLVLQAAAIEAGGGLQLSNALNLRLGW